MIKVSKRGSALLLGAGTSFLLALGGTVVALGYIFLSKGRVYYLSPYFTLIFFISVFCGGFMAGYRGGIRCWVLAGLIGLLWGLVLVAVVPHHSAVTIVLSLLVLPAICSSAGALLAANRVVRRQLLNRRVGPN